MQQHGKIALVGGTIIDVSREDNQFKGTVLLEDDHIKEIVSSEAEVENYYPTDVSGKYLIAGLIEMHGHFYGRATTEMRSQHEAYCPLYLAGGITTVRTPGEFEPEVTREWKRAIEAGEKPGPRIMSAGSYFDQTPSIVRWIEGSDSLEQLTEKYHTWKRKIDFVKVYSHTPAEWIKTLADLAHADGLKIYGHLGASTTADAIQAGIDGIEHGFFTMSEFYNQPDPGVRGADLAAFDPDGEAATCVIELILQNNVAVTPTTITFGLAGKAYSDWLDEIGAWRYLTSEGEAHHRAQRAEMDGSEEGVRNQNALLEKQYRFINRIYKGGGRIFCGTDPSYPLIVPGYAIVKEAQNLRLCGMGNMDILRALTCEAAKELNLDSVTGSLEAGKQADIVVLDGNPLENIDNLYTVSSVIKAGRLYDSAILRESAVRKMV